MTNYWHFARCDERGVPRLNYGDGREIVVGKTLTVEGEPVLCERGLHASKRALDALRYCEFDACLCLVELGGTVLHGDNKSVATGRTVIAMLSREQTDTLLREFARHCALSVAHLWDMPDVVRRYLETGDESLRAAVGAAARAAARDAVRDAAGAAARDAARAAAWAAARDAAGAAARAAAWAAAWAAVGAAVGAAARDAAWAAARDAAGAAVGAAVWDAVWDAQNEWLERRAAEMLEARNE